MTDTFSPKQRSDIMRAVKGKDTSLETAVRLALWRRGLRYRKNVPSRPGKPDIVFPGPKVVVFIDSCYWHGCPDHCRMPQANREYWERKIGRNKQRDKEINQQYEQLEWTVVRVWEHELKEDFEGTIDKIHNTVTALKHEGNCQS